jgi:hypothetical protein
VEFSPSRTTSPGKRVAPASIGDPFSSTCFPIMLVANTDVAVSRVAAWMDVETIADKNTKARKYKHETFEDRCRMWDEWGILGKLIPTVRGLFFIALP